MAFDAYIQIDGIPGEVLDDKHKDWIEVLGYEYGATQATSATASSSGGASSERVALSDFKIRKAVDKASAKLFEHCCTGKHIAKLKLNVNRAGGDKVTYLYQLLGKDLRRRDQRLQRVRRLGHHFLIDLVINRLQVIVRFQRGARGIRLHFSILQLLAQHA